MKKKSIYLRKLLALGLTILLMASVVTGCGGNSVADVSSGLENNVVGSQGVVGSGKAPANGPDTLTVAFVGEPPNLTTFDHNSQLGEAINLMTYNSLFYVDNNLNVVPDLCEDYTMGSDTEWVFNLRQGVKFHDGTEMHAEDVIASLEHAKASPQVARYTVGFDTIEEIDEYKVKITTPGPYALLLYDLAYIGNAILPKALIDSGNDFNKNPIGTGPFKFANWTLGDSLEFERFEDYFDSNRKAGVERLIIKIIPEGTSRTIALESGEVDLINAVTYVDLEKLQENTEITVLGQETTTLFYVILNNETPGLDNLKVRMALNAALDRDLVVLAALNNNGTPAYSQVPLGMPGSSDAGTIGYDMELAKQYMVESGVDPATLEISIICSDDTKRRCAEVIQAAWGELGINVQIESMELATYLAQTAEGNFSAAIGSFSQKNLLSWIKSVFHKSSINAVNKSRINDEAINQMIEQAEITVDEAERIQLLEKLCKVANESCTQVPLYQETMFKAYNANLQGVQMSRAGIIYYNMISWAE